MAAARGAGPGAVNRALSCGVVLTDGRHLLIGHATASARWDIPKGIAEPGEDAETAARRELLEETGLTAPGQALVAAGQHSYRPGKDLALFIWQVEAMPDTQPLRCTATFARGGRLLPELDRFACLPWSDALARLAPAMATVLSVLARERGWLGEGAQCTRL